MFSRQNGKHGKCRTTDIPSDVFDREPDILSDGLPIELNDPNLTLDRVMILTDRYVDNAKVGYAWYNGVCTFVILFGKYQVRFTEGRIEFHNVGTSRIMAAFSPAELKRCYPDVYDTFSDNKWVD